jgi:hypothetical protein
MRGLGLKRDLRLRVKKREYELLKRRKVGFFFNKNKN